MSQPRIISLIPSATEIVAALGMTGCLVGRSHECDYPTEVRHLPVCTQPKFDPQGTSLQVHERVTDLLQSALSVYRVDTNALEQLRPTHIITQAQCEVCAVSLADVEQAVRALSGGQPQVISLQPDTLADVWNDIRRVAAALEVQEGKLLEALSARVEICAQQTRVPDAARPSVACIEWIEPLMAAGNWVPEMVDLAGGKNLFGVSGRHSPWLTWADLLAADPEVIVVMPCGFDLARTREESEALIRRPEWQNLRAARTGRVYITDGNQYFNRPGPRLVDSLEILAEILHPDVYAFEFENVGWERLKLEAQLS